MRIYFVASIDRFIKPIIRELQAKGYECVLNNVFKREEAAQADVIWAEWADQNAISVMEYMTTAKKILRIHDYEIHTPIWNDLNPEAFDCVVFVSNHKKAELERKLGREITNSVVISNYVNPAHYVCPDDKQDNKNIAMLGYVCRRKGIGELLLIAESMPDYNFHIAGEVQEQDYQHFFEQGKPDNVTFHGYVPDVNEFYRDKAYVINTSLREAFAVSTVEGMLCGCKPIVRNWDGAKELYPEDCVYRSLDDIKTILEGNHSPEYYRSYAIENLNLNSVMLHIEAVINMEIIPDTYMPTVTVGVVQTRQKYMPELINSLRMQGYQIELRVLQNFDRDKSIGKCFNELADQCTTDFILYVGDDDWLAEGYVSQVMEAYRKRRKMYPKICALLTSTTAYDSQGNYALIPHHSTGVWRAEFVRQHRFDETLVRQVDTEFHNRVASLPTGGNVIVRLSWIAGYMYRQHDKNISGNKFTEGANLSQEPVK